MSVIFKDNIVYGGDVTTSITGPYRSLGKFFQERFKDDGDHVMMIDASTGKQYTRQEVWNNVIRLVQGMKRLGIKEGDVVGLCAPNSVEFAITLLATLALGVTAAPFNITYSERELADAVNLSRPKVFFTSKNSLNKVLAISKKNRYIKYVFVFGEAESNSGATPFAQLINSKRITHFDPPNIDKKENVALILCSSGTTGMPKGVQLTQLNVMFAIDWQHALGALGTPGLCVLSVIPWFHVFGCVTMVVGACMKTRLVFLPKYEETVFLGAIEKYQVEMAFVVPPLMVMLAKSPIVDRYNLSSVRFLYCGAAALSREIEDAVKKRTKIPFLRTGYGLSESTHGVLGQSNDCRKPGSVGTIKPGTWVKVVDPETGVRLGPNQRGELCFKGDCIMKGYIRDKRSTAIAIRDGWLHTGDIGYFDDDFEFFVVDRIKELIKYKGYQVPPAEIEALLSGHPKIKDAAVVGLPDESAGELPLAFVVKQPGVELTEAEVIKFVAENASPAKRLRGGVRFIDAIPKNPSGKVLRRVLRDMLKKTKAKL